MIHVINAVSPDNGLKAGLWLLKTCGVPNKSRNGPVLQAPGPVVTAYAHPDRRVMLSEIRDANPFFHLFEAVWMLAGCRHAAPLVEMTSNMEAFAEDGILWGAYGHRWRHFFDKDQLLRIVSLLTDDPKTRRAVLTMWSPLGDLWPVPTKTGLRGGPLSKDVPCNTQVYFDATRGLLDMTVTNRSNDIVWGCYGANVVHMSVLHEFVALATGLPLGTYYQFSNNYHIYPENAVAQRLANFHCDGRIQDVLFNSDPRHYMPFNRVPLVGRFESWSKFLDDCESAVWLYGKSMRHTPATHWMANVFAPMMNAYKLYKQDRLDEAIAACADVRADDWRIAGQEWIARRKARRTAQPAGATA